METYLLTLKVMEKERFNGVFYDTTRTYEMIIPSFIRNKKHAEDYLPIIMDKLFLLLDRTTIVYREDLQKTVSQGILKGIIDFQKNSISSKSRTVYKYSEEYANIHVSLKLCN